MSQTPADEFHIDKTEFTVPFVCGARNLGEALRRIAEGAAMIRTKGEAGTGDVREAVRHTKLIGGSIRSLKGKNKEELARVAREIDTAENPEKMANAIVEAVNNYDKPDVLAEISKGLGDQMKGIDIRTLSDVETLQTRGW
jgi:pyridoxal 5'-phosphate synthase pdxS subunit